MRKFLILLVLVLASNSLLATEFDFDKLDAELEADFVDTDEALEAQYQALDAALKQAYQRLGEEVEAVWGEADVELPSKTAWVDYSDDKQLRRKVDFETGLVEIERIVSADETDLQLVANEMIQAASQLAMDSQSDLSRKDTALNYAKQTLQAANIQIAAVTESSQPIIGSLGADLNSNTVEQLLAEVLEPSAALSKEPSEELNVEPLLIEKPTPNIVPKEATAKGMTAKISTLEGDVRKVSIQVPLRFGFQSTMASRYQTSVLKQSERYDLPPSLVYAVMETESSFNPRARSAVPAFGLMQLVPRSGAMDAYRYVYGEKTLLDPEYLYDADQNVELGSAYLKLVYTRYLRHITNLESRQICTIAAYNTGAGNVAKSFTGTTSVKKAAVIINQMTPEEVYEHLLENLPYDETRNYLKKVTKAMDKYAAMDKLAGNRL